MNEELRPTKTTKIEEGENESEKVERPEDIQQSKPLNKEQVQKQLEAEGEDDLMDKNFDPEADPTPAVIFDSELHFIKELKAVDIVFLVDATGSMSHFMKGVKRFVRKILWDAQKCLTQYFIDEVDVLLVSVVSYKDYDQEKSTYVSKIDCDLTSDFELFTKELMKIRASGGADIPEAVIEGLNTAVNKVKWRENSFKFLYHVLDAPPHGKTFWNNRDDFENQCSINYIDVLDEIKQKDINYTIIKLSDDVDTMITEFSSHCNFEVLDPEIKCDKSKAIPQE